MPRIGTVGAAVSCRKNHYLHHDLAYGSELDPIAKQVDQYLSDPGDISQKLGGHSIVHLVDDVQLLFRGFGCEQVE